MKKFFYLALAAITLSFAACGGDEPASISLDVTFKSVPLTGETFTVNVTSASAWTAAPTQNWVTVSPNEGKGDAAVTVTVAAGEEGVANVLFFDGDKTAILKIERTASPTSISCDPVSKTVSGAGESFTVALKSTGDWTATPDKSWVTVSPKVGQGDASVTVTVAAGGDANAKVVFKCGESTATLKIERVSSPTYAGGALPGKFSTKKRREYVDGEWQYDWIQIQFSQGNLQYNTNSPIWRFADNQWDVLNSTEGLMDMFCWGTGDDPTAAETWHQYIPQKDPETNFVDWGDNAISNGGNTPKTWFTLNREQWAALLHERPNGENLFGMGTVNGKKGIILLPDDWTTTPDGVPAFKSGVQQGLVWYNRLIDHNQYWAYYEGYYDKKAYPYNPEPDNAGASFDNDHFSDNTYTIDEWSAMQSAGAVFLPATSSNTEVTYWSSTYMGALNPDIEYPLCLKANRYHCETYAEIGAWTARCPVRLVREVK